MSAARATVLFDLDGTLSDSARGILAALRHAFAVHSLPPLDPATEQAILGPPFYESLPPLLGDVPLESIIAAYREHYGAGGMFDTVAFDGVADLVARLHATGTRLAVATSKPEHYAVPIVEHLGLGGYFEVIGGDALDGSRGTKALVIADVLRRLDHPTRRACSWSAIAGTTSRAPASTASTVPVRGGDTGCRVSSRRRRRWRSARTRANSPGCSGSISRSDRGGGG